VCLFVSVFFFWREKEGEVCASARSQCLPPAEERELEMRLASISGMDGTGRLIRVVLCSVSLVAKVVTCSPCRGVREARYFRQEDDGFDEGMPMRSADSSSRPAPELIGASPAERPDAERQNLV
ncbi:unnamed protein product, partial [Prorocentrum cordatum]